MLQPASARAGRGTQSSRIVKVGVGLAWPQPLCTRVAAAAARLPGAGIPLSLQSPSKPCTSVQAHRQVLKTCSHHPPPLLSSPECQVLPSLLPTHYQTHYQTHYHCLILAKLWRRGDPRHPSPPPDTVPVGTRPRHPAP